MSETLEALRTRERDMELEAIALRARVEELRAIIAILEAETPRRGRPRSMRVAGGTATPDTALPWDDEETPAA